MTLSENYLNLLESKQNDIILFPSDYENELRQGKKSMTVRVHDEVGKYQKRKIYKVFTYEGNKDLHMKIKILDLTHGKYKDFTKNPEQMPDRSDVDKKHVKIAKISPNDPADRIRFELVKEPDDILRFPSDFKDVVTQGVKNITFRIKDEYGKYQKGGIYRVFSYDGEDWNTRVRVLEVTSGRYKDFKEGKQRPSSTDFKSLKYVSPLEPMDKIRFTLAK